MPDSIDSDVHCVGCDNGHILVDDVCELSNQTKSALQSLIPTSRPSTFVPTAPSMMPTSSPTSEFGVTFSITYSYAVRSDMGMSEPVNVTEDAAETATAFLNDTISSVNASCVKSSHFNVVVDENAQEITIIGSIYACDNETMFAVIDRIMNNITLKMQGESLAIVGDTIEIVAEVITIDELKISTFTPTKGATIETPEKETLYDNEYIIGIICINVVVTATCCILAVMCWRLMPIWILSVSMHHQHQADVVNVVMNHVNSVHSVSESGAQDQPGGREHTDNEKHSGVDPGDL